HVVVLAAPTYTPPPFAQLLGQIRCLLFLQHRRARPFAPRLVVTGAAARDAGSRVTILKELGASTPFFPVRLERPIGRRRRKAGKIGRRLGEVVVVDIGRAGLHLAAIVVAAAVTKVPDLLHDIGRPLPRELRKASHCADSVEAMAGRAQVPWLYALSDDEIAVRQRDP